MTSVNGEPQFQFVSFESDVPREEVVAGFYVDTVNLVYGVCVAQGIDPTERLTPGQVALAEADEAEKSEMARQQLSDNVTGDTPDVDPSDDILDESWKEIKEVPMDFLRSRLLPNDNA